MPVNLRTLKDNWLLDAAAAEAELADQLTWLQAQRVTLSAAVRAGDWAVTSQSAEGSSHSSIRGVGDMDQLTALIAAIKDLQAQLGLSDGSSTGAMLTISATDILA